VTDIDWLAVDLVVSGQRLALRPDEKRAVIRRLESKMLVQGEQNQDVPPWRLTATQLAERMLMSKRNVERLASELPEADKAVCPVCRGPMWVLWTGVVEPHGDGFHETCPMSDRFPRCVVGLLPMPTGLLRMRIVWLVASGAVWSVAS